MPHPLYINQHMQKPVYTYIESESNDERVSSSQVGLFAVKLTKIILLIIQLCWYILMSFSHTIYLQDVDYEEVEDVGAWNSHKHHDKQPLNPFTNTYVYVTFRGSDHIRYYCFQLKWHLYTRWIPFRHYTLRVRYPIGPHEQFCI